MVLTERAREAAVICRQRRNMYHLFLVVAPLRYILYGPGDVRSGAGEPAITVRQRTTLARARKSREETRARVSDNNDRNAFFTHASSN